MIYFILSFALNIINVSTYNGLTCANDEIEFKTLCVTTTCMNIYNSALKTIGSSKFGNVATNFSVEATYTPDQTIKVIVSFNDSKDAGLLSQDNPNSCIDISLYKTSFLYYDKQPLDYPLSTNYLHSGMRLISFEFGNLNDYNNQLQDNTELNFTTYYGYYYLDFKIDTLVVLTLRIQFMLKINIITQEQIKSVANLKLIKDDYNCYSINGCFSYILGSSQFCADRTCEIYIDQLKFSVNKSYFIKQYLDIPSSFPSTWIDQPTLLITSNNLTREIPIISTQFQYSRAGEIIIEFKIEFLYSFTWLAIQVSSLIIPIYRGTPLSQHLEPTHLVTQVYFNNSNCIYSDITSTSCPTCAEMEKYSTMTTECIVNQLGCVFEESVVNGICVDKSCLKYQELLKIIWGFYTVKQGDDGLDFSFYFQDEQLNGIMQKDNPNSCITHKLFRHNSILFANGTQDYSVITSTYGYLTKYRCWTFHIKQNDFSTALIIDNSTYLAIYSGYYSYQFSQGQKVLQTFNFNFKMTFNPTTNISSFSLYSPIMIANKGVCNKAQKCVSTVTSNLMVCQTKNCTSEASEFILGDIIYLMQTITLDGFLDFDLRPLQIEFYSNGFQRTFQFPTVVLSEKGKIIVAINSNFTYSKYLKVIISSQISDFRAVSLQESSYFCIKLNSNSICESVNEAIVDPLGNSHGTGTGNSTDEFNSITEEKLMMQWVYVPLISWGVFSAIVFVVLKKIEA